MRHAYTPGQWRTLLTAARSETYETGETVVRTGDLGGDVFYVQSGCAEAVDGSSTPPRLLTSMGPGEIFGDIAFLDGSPRSADVIAAEPTEIFRFPKEDLQRILDVHPDIARAFYRAVLSTQTTRIRRLTLVSSPPPSGPRGPTVFGANTFLPERSAVVRDGEQVGLSPNEAKLLSYFIARPGRTLSLHTLLQEVWGYSDGVASRTVYVTIGRLRSKIEGDPNHPVHLVAVRGQGYRFEP